MVTAARAAGRKKARPEALQNCYRTIRKVLAWLQEGFYRVHTIPRHHVEPIRMAPGSGPLRSCCLGRGRARSPAFGPALTPQGSPHNWQGRQTAAGTPCRYRGTQPNSGACIEPLVRALWYIVLFSFSRNILSRLWAQRRTTFLVG